MHSNSPTSFSSVKLETLPKDVLFTLALELDLPSMLKWCRTNAYINEKVCNNSAVWNKKLLTEYPDSQKFNLNKTGKEMYIFMHHLSLVKKELLYYTKESLYDIFLERDLTFRTIKN